MFSIALSRGYNEAAFKEDMRKLFTQLGVQKKPTVFLFTAAQIAEEGKWELNEFDEKHAKIQTLLLVLITLNN